jgi:hypothetical protein
MPTEESGIPLAPEVESTPSADAPPETETPVVAAPDAGAAPPDPAAAEAAHKRGVSALREAFAGELDNEELDALADGLDPEHFKKLDKATQASIRAFLRTSDKEVEARKSDWEKREKAISDKEAAIKASERSFKQREAALLEQAAAAKAPGAKPEIDPFTPEGAAALAKYHAEQAAYEREAPLRERAREVRIQAAWDALCDQHPDLRNDKVSAEFDAFMAEKNKGVDRSKGQSPRLTAEDGAIIFFSNRKLAALQSKQTDTTRRSDADRADAARHIGRARGGAAPDRLAAYDRLRETDRDAAWNLLESDPELQRAFKQRAGIRA